MQIKFIILFVLMSFVVPSSIDYDDIYYFANEDSEEVEEIQDQNLTYLIIVVLLMIIV